jgi:DNA-binding cell septation regulator SpoVG
MTPTVTVEKLQPNPKPGSTRAFVTFTAHGIRVIDARIVEGSKGTFLAMPQKSWETQRGETKYSNIVEITDEDLKA